MFPYDDLFMFALVGPNSTFVSSKVVTLALKGVDGILDDSVGR